MGSGGRIQNVEIVIGGAGVQCGLQTCQTGIGNGTGGKADIGVSVVGMVDPQILCSQIGLTIQSVDDRGVDVQEGRRAAPVERPYRRKE